MLTSFDHAAIVHQPQYYRNAAQKKKIRNNLPGEIHTTHHMRWMNVKRAINR